MQACPKCRYERKPADTAPEWQCPSCGIAYAKFAAAPPAPSRDSSAAGRELSFPFSRRALVLALVAVPVVAYIGYERRKSRGEDGRNYSSTGGEVLQTDNPALVATLDDGVPTFRLKPEVSAQLARFTKARVVLFATSWCPYCAQVRDLFATKGVSYVEYDIERDLNEARFLQDVLHSGGVPAIVIGNRLVIGYDEPGILTGLKDL